MTDKNLFLDFETASKTDLPKHGLGRYIADETTRPQCLAFRLPGMRSTDLWEFWTPFPKQLSKHIEDGGLFVAHNAPFDFHIWNDVLRRYFPAVAPVRIEQVRCTAARARYNGLPGSLENACAAMNLDIQKDIGGSAVMLMLAANPDFTPETHPAEFARMYKYALTDVDAMIGLYDATQPLTPQYQREFELDMRINIRGFEVDVEAAQAMEDLKALAEAQLDYQVTILTQGGVLAISEVAKIKEYAGTFGEEIDDAGKEALKKIAARTDIPAEFRELLELRLDASRAPKKSAAILRAHVNGIITHSTKFHGALSGRSTASGAGGLQALNFSRPRPGKKAEQCEAFLEAARRHDTAFLSSPQNGPILAALADAQRSLVYAAADDEVVVGCDLSGIEARMAPWLANDEEKLADFEAGIDGYKKAATNIFYVEYDEVDKDQRQVGKVSDLSLGFGGGSGAFGNMAANYGVHLPDDQIDNIVWNWRAARPAFERWWSVLEYAVLIALDQPGKPVEVPVGRGWCSKVVFTRDAVALRMLMPSGRTISYHNARLHLEPGAQIPIAVYDKPEGYTETLDRKIISNNLTQGAARDFFWEIMCAVDPVEPIRHHVYDELVLTVKRAIAETRLAQLIERMRIPPKWAPGLPLDAAGYVAKRWRKD